MTSSEMERYLRKIDTGQLAQVRSANQSEQQIRARFVTSGWYSYCDPLIKYSTHLNTNNKAKPQQHQQQRDLPRENCTKSQKFHFLYHKTFTHQKPAPNGKADKQEQAKKEKGEEKVVMLLQIPAHEEFFFRTQTTNIEAPPEAAHSPQTHNRAQILDWYGQSFGAALTASLNGDLEKENEQKEKIGSLPPPVTLLTAAHPIQGEEEQEGEDGDDVSYPPWPLPCSPAAATLTQRAHTWVDPERRRESLIAERELSMHLLGAYRQPPVTPKTPAVENPFQRNVQAAKGLLPNESKRRGHRRSYWRRKATVVASLRPK